MLHHAIVGDHRTCRNRVLRGVVGVAEIVVHGDRFDDALDGFLAKRGNAWGDDCDSAMEMLAQLVIQHTNLFGFRDHECLICVKRTAATSPQFDGAGDRLCAVRAEAALD